MRDELWSSWGGQVPAFVGRADERKSLEQALERTSRFLAPQFVTVVGAPGIGKSRLVGEWLMDVEARGDFRVIRAAAEPDGDPLAFIGRLLRARFGIEPGVDEEVALGWVKEQLQSVFADRRVGEVAGLLGRFLGYAAPEGPLADALASRPEQQAEVARAVLRRFLEDDALLRPTVWALDDLHNADDESLDLLHTLSVELAESPLVIVAAARPELWVRRPEWGRNGGSHARVDLTPLSPPQVTQILHSALGAETLPPGIAERAAIESSGNPARLGELLGVFRTYGVLDTLAPAHWTFDAERARAAGALAESPEEAAHARVAELSPAGRELLARAAAFGTTFWTGGVIALGRLGGEPPDPTTVFAPDRNIEEVRRMLAELAERSFIIRETTSVIAGETEWRFAHAAERAFVLAAFDPEVLRRRRLFAAQWLEGRTPLEDVSDRFELLGALYEGGGDARRAGECFVAAGDRALREHRLERARGLTLRGVRLLDLDDSVFKMDALHKVGDIAARLGRTREALAHFGEMLRIAWRLDLPAKGGAAHARIGRLHRTLGDFKLAARHLELGRLLFELAGDEPGIAATLDDLGRVHLLTGNAHESLRYHRAALALREALNDERGKALTLSWTGLAEAQAGNLAAAVQSHRAALNIYRASGDRRGIAYCLVDLGAIEQEAARPQRARPLFEEARQLAREQGELLSECQFTVRLAECLLVLGRPADALEELAAAREVARKFGARRLLCDIERIAAEAQLAGGQVALARGHADLALELAEKLGSPTQLGAALRVLGVALGAGAPGDSERGGPREVFDRALEVLSRAGAELELGRALAAYADHEQQQGRLAAASDLRGQAAAIRVRAFAAVRELPQAPAVPAAPPPAG